MSLCNAEDYLIIGLRWAFYGAADMHIAVSPGMTLTFLVASLAVVWWVSRPDGESGAEPARLNRR